MLKFMLFTLNSLNTVDFFFPQTFPKPPEGLLKLGNCVFILELSSELLISEFCFKEWTKGRGKQCIFKVFAYVHLCKKVKSTEFEDVL